MNEHLQKKISEIDKKASEEKKLEVQKQMLKGMEMLRFKYSKEQLDLQKETIELMKMISNKLDTLNDIAKKDIVVPDKVSGSVSITNASDIAKSFKMPEIQKVEIQNKVQKVEVQNKDKDVYSKSTFISRDANGDVTSVTDILSNGVTERRIWKRDANGRVRSVDLIEES